eukprot:114203-Chlamydomonas_euryale.AAC.1
MERPAQKLAMMILAVSPRLENVWVKCSPAMVLDWLSKADLSIMDKIDVLRAVRSRSCVCVCAHAKGSCPLSAACMHALRATCMHTQCVVQVAHSWRGARQEVCKLPTY